MTEYQKKLPFDTIVAHKTGSELSIYHDIGIVFMPKGDMLICVLTKPDNNEADSAKEFISDIALAVYNYHLRSLN